MISDDASKQDWIANLPNSKKAIVILEGISMYLKNDDVIRLFLALQNKYENVSVLMEVYTTFGARASKYKNPINDVGVTEVYGIDNPNFVKNNNGIYFIKEHTMTPKELVNELSGFDKLFFSKVFAGKAIKKIYRLFEYELKQR